MPHYVKLKITVDTIPDNNDEQYTKVCLPWTISRTFDENENSQRNIMFHDSHQNYDMSKTTDLVLCYMTYKVE